MFEQLKDFDNSLSFIERILIDAMDGTSSLFIFLILCGVSFFLLLISVGMMAEHIVQKLASADGRTPEKSDYESIKSFPSGLTVVLKAFTAKWGETPEETKRKGYNRTLRKFLLIGTYLLSFLSFNLALYSVEVSDKLIEAEDVITTDIYNFAITGEKQSNYERRNDQLITGNFPLEVDGEIVGQYATIVITVSGEQADNVGLYKVDVSNLAPEQLDLIDRYHEYVHGRSYLVSPEKLEYILVQEDIFSYTTVSHLLNGEHSKEFIEYISTAIGEVEPIGTYVLESPKSNELALVDISINGVHHSNIGVLVLDRSTLGTAIEGGFYKIDFQPLIGQNRDVYNVVREKINSEFLKLEKVGYIYVR